MLAMKRFIADFIDADAGKPKQLHQQPKANLVGGASVVFISPNTKLKGPWPVCHVCNKQHDGG